jgi:hypothetical protein
MKTLCKYLALTLVVVIALVSASMAQTITTAGSGNWSSTTAGAPWPGGTVPTATDTVIIADSHTVTIDSTATGAQCKMLTIGTTGTSNTTVRFALDGTHGTLTVNGDIVLAAANSRLRVESRSPAGAANTFVEHILNLYGNLNNTAGGIVDFRGGSNASGTSNGVLLNLLGSSNSTITLKLTAYTSGTEEFNSITVNKSGSGRVILAGGNLYMSNNTSTGATILTFVDGLVETGTYKWVTLSTNVGGVAGASDTSYVLGNLGRGFSNSSTSTQIFTVGDAAGYRPISLSSTTPGSATGHHAVVSVQSGNANTGSSTFTGDIDRVSAYRYYKVTYVAMGGAATMGYNYFAPSYRTNDGVVAGNTDLRVAYSSDSLATWNGIANTVADTTNLATPPTTIAPDSLGTAVTLNDGASLYVALARKAGTATNPLAALAAIFHVSPKFTGGPLTSTTTLEQPLAFYVEVQNLEPGASYEQHHIGFLTSGTTSTRGSKWSNNAWVSPSTVLPSWFIAPASGTFKTWAFVRSPSSYIVGIDTAIFRFRIRKTGTTTNLNFDGDKLSSLLLSDTAAAAIAGTVVYGYTDTVSQNNPGKFILLYQNENDVRPLSCWLVYKTPTSLVDTNLYQTRTDSALRRTGYFQMVVPAATPIGKIEIRDSSNNILRMQTSSTWMSGAVNDTTNLSTQEGIVLSVKQISDYVPQEFSVSQNYPNPFNPMTTIRFSLKTAGKVSLKVYDMVGREVAVLANDTFAAGSYLVEWNAARFSSGTYFYVLETAAMKETRKMVLVR